MGMIIYKQRKTIHFEEAAYEKSDPEHPKTHPTLAKYKYRRLGEIKYIYYNIELKCFPATGR